ncbi:proton-conducting transporter membrane subunit, partial [Pseudonocardia sp. ICBG601]|uniref:proton-conducting transporter transmembrane domain-containing protein n=1 Tax=Pseudonocardia sp. ICBG601 TaxID=2846759 RepID=UPI0021F5A62F
MGALPEGLRAVLALVLIVVFGIKAAIVPLHFWLPDSYPNAPAPVTALFAGLLTKVGIYALLRTQTLVFPQDSPSTLLLVIAAVTMVVGPLGAVAQETTSTGCCRSCWSATSGHGVRARPSPPDGIAGTGLYVVHHITVQATLFLVSGLITRRTGTVSISQMGGLAQQAPHLAVLFAIPRSPWPGCPRPRGSSRSSPLLQAGAGAGLAGELVAARRRAGEPADPLRRGPGLGAGVLGRPKSPSPTTTRTTSSSSGPHAAPAACTSARPRWSWSASR